MDPKAIRQRSRKAAADMGIDIASSLPFLESVSHTKSQEAILARLLCLHVVVACSYGFDRDRGIEWLKGEGLAKALTERESTFLNIGVGERTSFQFSIEGIWALSWVLGLVPKLDFSTECPSDFFFLMPNLKQAQPSLFLRDRVNMRSIDEIVAALDLSYCLHWAVRNGAIKAIPLQTIARPHAIIERRRALEWVIGSEAWDEVSLDT